MTNIPMYHFARPGLVPGDTIVPGNWGRLVLSIPDHRWASMEHRFESARQQLSPHLPSRLSCAYAFDEDRAIEIYGAKSPGSALYRVEMVIPDAVIHRANILLVHPKLGHLPTFEDWAVNAKEYWVPTKFGPDVDGDYLPEILIASPLRVVQVHL